MSAANMNRLAPEDAKVPATAYRGHQALDAMDDYDALPRELRQCVAEFGLPIVNVLVKYGITKPGHIRDIVRECWEGPRNFHQRKAGPTTVLDWLLLKAGASMSADTLIRSLRMNNYVVVPSDPSPAMIEASMDAVNHMGVVSKRVKHRNRLIAALKAGSL